MDHDVEKTTIEDNPAGEFDNRLLKRAKNLESSVMDDSLPSLKISTSSSISESPESFCSESENEMNNEPLSSTQSPTRSSLSPISELMNEEIASIDDDKLTIDDDKLADEPKSITNNLTYDYLPQGKYELIIFTFVAIAFHESFIIFINVYLLFFLQIIH
jgi:hypothetical protein